MAIEKCSNCGGNGYTILAFKGINTKTTCRLCGGKEYVCTLCGTPHEHWSKMVPNLGPLPCACEVDPQRRQNPIHVDSLDSFRLVADHIISNWNDWVASAGQTGQVEQSEAAAHLTLRRHIAEAIQRHYTRDWGNHL